MTKGPVLILGGRSEIGLAIAHRFARDGHPIQLAARRANDLGRDKADIELRYGVSVTLHEFNALKADSNIAFVEGLETLPEIAVSAVGLLGDQRESEQDIEAATLVMRSNYEGPATILAVLANRFEERGSGTLVGISSVAGDRGRRANYVYGSAKAGFTAFLSGLRSRLAAKGVHVVTVKPGYVDTKMTSGKNLPRRLTATPEEVADAVAQAVSRKRDVIYVKPIWALVMAAIRALPESLFKRARF